MEFQIDEQVLRAVFKLPDNCGTYGPQMLQYLRGVGARRKAVFLAFAPKAAGTFLRQAVIAATGGDLVRIGHAQGGRDAQLYLPTLLGYFLGGVCKGPLVAHAHMQALPANVRMLDAFGIRPVIMLRNIPDMLASYWDMLDNEPGALENGLNCAIPRRWRDMKAEERGDFMVDMMGPWYASYYATWLSRCLDDDTVLALHYTDLLDNPAACLDAILRHSGFEHSRAYYDLVINDLWDDRYTLRFNQGIAGRGMEYFSSHQRDRLARMLRFHGIGDSAGLIERLSLPSGLRRAG